MRLTAVVFTWLIVVLFLILTFIPAFRRVIARHILAPYHIPLRSFRWILGVSIVGLFLGIGATAPPEKQTLPSASATTAVSTPLKTPAAARPVTLETPAPDVSPSEGASTETEPAYDLAVIQAGHRVDPTDPSVAHFQGVLNLLSRSYGETPQQIADKTVKAQQLLAAKGLDDSLDDIIHAMITISTAKAHIPYADALASYIVLREGGEGKG